MQSSVMLDQSFGEAVGAVGYRCLSLLDIGDDDLLRLNLNLSVLDRSLPMTHDLVTMSTPRGTCNIVYVIDWGVGGEHSHERDASLVESQ